jgi:hypothetical protein
LCGAPPPNGAAAWRAPADSLARHRCSLRQFDTATAGCLAEEAALVAGLAAAWGGWTRPLVVTLQGKSALLPLSCACAA